MDYDIKRAWKQGAYKGTAIFLLMSLTLLKTQKMFQDLILYTRSDTSLETMHVLLLWVGYLNLQSLPQLSWLSNLDFTLCKTSHPVFLHWEVFCKNPAPIWMKHPALHSRKGKWAGSRYHARDLSTWWLGWKRSVRYVRWFFWGKTCLQKGWIRNWVCQTGSSYIMLQIPLCQRPRYPYRGQCIQPWAGWIQPWAVGRTWKWKGLGTGNGAGDYEGYGINEKSYEKSGW